jgi:hypothetical protein
LAIFFSKGKKPNHAILLMCLFENLLSKSKLATMSLCRWMHRAVALLPLIVLSSASKNYRRCVAARPNHEFLELKELRSVSCVECANISSTLTVPPNPNEDSISVALFVEAHDDHYYPQAIAASLLNHSHRVTMLTSPDMPHTEKEITETILRYVPCEQQALARSLLSVRTVPMARYRTDCPYYGEIMCHVPDRAWVHALYSAVQSIDGLDVMLLEATSIAALLVTEHFKIPSIAMANDLAQLREVLGSTYRHRKSSWTPLGWRRWLEDMFLNRWHNLAGTAEFMSLNVLRRRLRMRSIRTVTDIWKAPGSVIMTTLPSSSTGGQDSNLQSFTSPILPPCLPCWSIEEEETNIEPVIIVTTHGQPTSLANARFILKGLSIAIASIREFRDDKAQAFSVVWLPTEGAAPAIMPDFVTVEQGSLLDSLARYTNAVAIVTQCVDDSLWIKGLGTRILCWDESSSPRDLSLRLLQLLQKPVVEPAQLTRGDCLRRIVSLVERVANVKRIHGSEWKTAADMGRDLKAGLHLREENIPENNGGLFVFAAWCILVSAVFYVIHEKTFPTHTSRLRRYRYHQRPTFTDIMDEIVFRLPELEQTWGIWSDWSKENLSDMEDSVPASAPRERADSKDGTHSTHAVRKRRPAKNKRH